MLKHKGPSVDLVDSSGSDLTVANSARVSFNKTSDWDYVDNGAFGQKRVLSERDKKLIKYLAKHNHWTPFAHCFVTFRVTCCIAVARQLHKHQVGLVVNEVSRRYVSDEPTFYVPDALRGKAVDKKQGSSDVVVEKWAAWEIYGVDWGPMELAYRRALQSYHELLERGVCEEQARLVLPLGANTEFVWSGSLAAWARVINLRTSEDAQKETRDVAELIAQHIKQLYPVSYEALCGKDNRA